MSLAVITLASPLVNSVVTVTGTHWGQKKLLLLLLVISSCSSCSCISRCSRCSGFNHLSMILIATNIFCSRHSLFLPASHLRSTNGFCFHLSLFMPAAHLRLTNGFCFRLSLHIHPYSSTYSSIHDTLHIHSPMPRFHWWQKPPPAAPELVFWDAIKAALVFPCIFIHIHPHKHPSSNALKAACSWLVHWTCLMVVALRRTTLSGNGIEGCSVLHWSPSSDISESVFCIVSGLYAKSQFDWEQETHRWVRGTFSLHGCLHS